MPKPLSDWIHLLVPDEVMPEKIVFRVDAGRIWGLSFGHLLRCLTLARTFQKSYHADIMFLMRDYPEGIDYARASGQQVEVIPAGASRPQETEQIVTSVKRLGANLVAIDLPYQDIETSYFPLLKKEGRRLLFLDDCRYISPDVDIILNSSILALTHTKQVERIRYLLGPEYFIYEAPLQRPFPFEKDSRFHVVVTFGGSDPEGLTIKALKAIAPRDWEQVVFHVLLGPGYADFDQLRRRCLANTPNTISMIHNPPEVYSFFLNCDLAICAGGRTLYELFTFQIPTFAIAGIEHEVPVVREFLKQNLLVAGLESWDAQQFVRLLRASIMTIKSQK